MKKKDFVEETIIYYLCRDIKQHQPMLSILIPTYNYDCTKLVASLLEQLPEGGEIIVADDGSSNQEILHANRVIHEHECCRLWESKENLGRAAIRNRLADMANGDYIIFIDCDAEVDNPHFISNYVRARTEADVVCGGTKTPALCPGTDKSLRYKYEKEYWSRRRACFRQKEAYSSFTTFNFLIKRETFLKIRFDERCKHYGHEDTLFGIELKKNNIDILHIDNELVHCGLDTNKEFLIKTETAIKSLIETSEYNSQMQDEVRLLRYRRLAKKYHLDVVFNSVYSIFDTKIKRNLLGENPNLKLFQLYKLNYCLRS